LIRATPVVDRFKHCDVEEMPGGVMRKCHKFKNTTKTNKAFIALLTLVISLAFPVAVYANGVPLKREAQHVGRAVGSTAHRIGQVGKKVGVGVARSAVEVGHAAKAGAIEFWSALRGHGTANNRSLPPPK
jgi:hypothetical protein